MAAARVAQAAAPEEAVRAARVLSKDIMYQI
jgi:hypothetical protein